MIMKMHRYVCSLTRFFLPLFAFTTLVGSTTAGTEQTTVWTFETDTVGQIAHGF